MPRILYVVNDAGYFLAHRLPVALAARTAGFEVHVAAPDSDNTNRLCDYGMTHHVWQVSRSGKNPFSEALSFWKLLEILRRVKPDILHSITIKPVLYGCIAARLAGVRAIVATVSGLGTVFTQRGFSARLVLWLITRLYRAAFALPRLCVVFENPHDRETLLGLTHLRPEQTLVCGVGVDLQDYVLHPLPEGMPVVLLAARLLRAKGVVEFVEAARRLKQSNAAVRFVLAGTADPGNPDSLTEAEIQAWHSAGTVEHWGHRSDMPNVLAQAVLVVLPSYREGLPRILMEAAAVGRAVVTTDCPGCRDAITPGVTGLLVPPRDAGALADALEKLLSDREALVRMGRAGRELAEREFDVRGVVEKHLGIYRMLLAGEKSP